MSVLVDSSVWIAYLRRRGDAESLDWLIDEDLIVTNELILAELVPPLQVRRKRTLIRLLREIECLPLHIDWSDIIRFQVTCLREGINKVGIPDLIIAQHALQNHLALYSLDRHFRLMSEHLPLVLY